MKGVPQEHMEEYDELNKTLVRKHIELIVGIT